MPEWRNKLPVSANSALTTTQCNRKLISSVLAVISSRFGPENYLNYILSHIGNNTILPWRIACSMVWSETMDFVGLFWRKKGSQRLERVGPLLIVKFWSKCLNLTRGCYLCRRSSWSRYKALWNLGKKQDWIPSKALWLGQAAFRYCRRWRPDRVGGWENIVLFL